MPNTFEEQAKDRFHKSHAFMQKATALLQDDLVYRSALADAVSSIKNMLQGYLLLRVARTPTSAVTQRWQEVAASNRMPDLLQACGEAGLDLRGLAVEIKRLNNERNYRTHDDPQRLVDPDQAAYALDLAQTVQKRIRAANQGTSAAGITPATIPTANRRVTTSADRARQAPAQLQAADAPLLPLDDYPTSQVSDGPKANGHIELPSSPMAPPEQDNASPTPTRTQAAEDSPTNDDMPAAVEPQDDDEALLPDDTALSLPVVTRRRNRIGRALVQTLIAVMLVVAGVAAGAVLTLPIAMGHTPQWLSFATQYLPADATPSPTSTPIPTATPSPTTGSVTVGALTVQSTPCQAGVTILTLHNTGTAVLHWALGAPDVPTATFTAGKSATGAATQFGTLAASASVTVAASAPAAGGTYRVVVVAPEGTVQLLLAAC
ncbi:MAG: hypothetical protein ACXWQ5_07075 [Ktedonobacterales bacterium]